MILAANQIRQACALLRWSSPTLAERSGVAYEVVCTAWSRASVEALSDHDHVTVRAALEKAGVEFILEKDGGAGVRLRVATS